MGTNMSDHDRPKANLRATQMMYDAVVAAVVAVVVAAVAAVAVVAVG